MHISEVSFDKIGPFITENGIDNTSKGLNVVVGANGSGKSSFMRGLSVALAQDFNGLQNLDVINSQDFRSGVPVVRLTLEGIGNKVIKYQDGSGKLDLEHSFSNKHDAYKLGGKRVSKADYEAVLEELNLSKDASSVYFVQQGQVNELATASDESRLQLLHNYSGATAFDTRINKSTAELDQINAEMNRLQEVVDENKVLVDQMRQSLKDVETYTDLKAQLNSIQSILYQVEIKRIEFVANDLNSKIEKLSATRSAEADKVGGTHGDLDELESDLNEKDFVIAELREKMTSYNLEISDLHDRVAELQRAVNDENGPIETNELETDRNLKASEPASSYKSLLDSVLQQQGLSTGAEFINAVLSQLKTQQLDSKSLKGCYIMAQKNLAAVNQLESLNFSGLAKLSPNHVLTDFSIYKYSKQLGLLTAAIEENNNLSREVFMKLRRDKLSIDSIRQKLEAIMRNSNSYDSEFLAGIAKVHSIVENSSLEGEYLGTLAENVDINASMKNVFNSVHGGADLFCHVFDSAQAAGSMMEKLEQTSKEHTDSSFFHVTKASCTYLENLSDGGDSARMDMDLPEGCQYLLDFITPNADCKHPEQFNHILSKFYGRYVVCRDLPTGMEVVKQFKLNAISVDGDLIEASGKITGGKEFYTTAVESKHDVVKDFTAKVREMAEHTKSISDLESKNNFKLENEKLMRTISVIKDLIRADSLERTKNGLVRVPVNSVELAPYLTKFMEDYSKFISNVSNLWQGFQNDVADELKSKFGEDVGGVESSGTNFDEVVLNYQLPYETLIFKDSKTQDLPVISSLESAGAGDQMFNGYSQFTNQIRDLFAAFNKYCYFYYLATTQGTSQPLTSQLIESDPKEQLLHLESELKRLITLKNHSETELEQQLEPARNDLADQISDLKAEMQSFNSKSNDNLRAIDRLMVRMASLDKLRNDFQEKKMKLEKEVATYDKVDELPANLSIQQAATQIADLESDEQLDEFVDPYKDLEKDVAKSLEPFDTVNSRAYQVFVFYNQEVEKYLTQLEELKSKRLTIDLVINKLQADKLVKMVDFVDKIAASFEKYVALLTDRKGVKLVPVRGDPITLKVDGQDQEYENYTALNIKANRVRSVAQLSGGEKTAFALALLFAVQTSNPSPLYIFDEIDANLDMAVRAKVANILRELSRRTQFFISTFHKEIVLHADRCYGVSFDDGESKMETIPKDIAIKITESSDVQD